MRFSAPKLEDCSRHGADAELFIVEGDSAARTINRIRNPANQAVFPMQGKPMNAIKADLDDLLENKQFAALEQSLGIDLYEPLDLERLRYGKIILLFDPDADGIHARTLMLFFFYKWLRPLLDAGRVYDTHAPQWKITSDSLKSAVYADTEWHFEKVKQKLESSGVTDYKIKRYRGLASVDDKVLHQQCIDSDSREVLVLSAENAEAALELFEQMRQMGRE